MLEWERQIPVALRTIAGATTGPRLMCDAACHMVRTCYHHGQLYSRDQCETHPVLQGLPFRFCARLLVDDGDSRQAVIFLF